MHTHDVDQELVAAATHVARTRCRGDNHTMAAAARATDGRIVTAVNACHFTGGPCAEPVVVGTAAAQDAYDLETIAAVGDRDRGVVPPCGRCRQVLLDSFPALKVVVGTADGLLAVPVADLLPHTCVWADHQLDPSSWSEPNIGDPRGVPEGRGVTGVEVKDVHAVGDPDPTETGDGPHRRARRPPTPPPVTTARAPTPGQDPRTPPRPAGRPSAPSRSRPRPPSPPRRPGRARCRPSAPGARPGPAGNAAACSTGTPAASRSPDARPPGCGAAPPPCRGRPGRAAMSSPPRTPGTPAGPRPPGRCSRGRAGPPRPVPRPP